MYPEDPVVADGHVYWIDQDKIGRVSVDGNNLKRSFIRAGAGDLGGVADGLATDGTYLYFTRSSAGAIARVKLTGTGLDRTFIPLGGHIPGSLAYAPPRLYWEEAAKNDRELIGRATRDGESVEPAWLNVGLLGSFEIAAGSGMLFWTWGYGDKGPNYVGRASLDGTVLDRRFVRGASADLGP